MTYLYHRDSVHAHRCDEPRNPIGVSMTRTETISFGALALQAGGAGVSTYCREILREVATIAPESCRLSAIVQETATGELPSRVEPRTVRPNRGIVRALWAKAPIQPVDVFHSLDADLPVWGPRASIATIHDLSVVDVPWAFSNVRARGERVLVGDAIRRADAIIAVSDFTAQRIWEIGRRDATVTPLAPAPWATPATADDVIAIRRKFDLPEKFVLQVGTVEPRKRPHLVAEAARSIGIPVVLAGAGSTEPTAPNSAYGLGYVDAEDLPALYGAATVVTYASVYEGFGLPPIEAMACGACVVASRVGALPDVVGDGAILVGSERLDDWVAALTTILEDSERRIEMRREAITAARTLTWRDTAERTLDVYRTVGAARVSA